MVDSFGHQPSRPPNTRCRTLLLQNFLKVTLFIYSFYTNQIEHFFRRLQLHTLFLKDQPLWESRCYQM